MDGVVAPPDETIKRVTALIMIMRRSAILLAFGMVLLVLSVAGVAAAGTETMVGMTLLEALQVFIDFLDALMTALGEAGINPELSSEMEMD